jgi:nucleobindin
MKVLHTRSLIHVLDSSFFHTEEFHSTPETQTDESYNHPEDIEHFAHHEAIEREEAEREARFQGITVEEALAAHSGEGSSPGVVPPDDGQQQPFKPKITRLTPPEKQDPRIKYKNVAKERDTQSEWGTGEEGYKMPKSPGERMR